MNPSTGEALPGEFHDAHISQVDDALSAAEMAFRILQSKGESWQVVLLQRLASAIEEHSEQLIARACQESALPIARLQGELARTTGQLRLMASVVEEGSWVNAVIDNAQPERKPAPRPDLRRMQIPLGPVVVFDAVNFPFAFGACGNDTASALAAGCPVVVKSHPSHAGTDELFAIITATVLEDLGLPLGLFSVLHARGSSISKQLAQHPSSAAIGFTGSFTGGTAIAAHAAARPSPIPVFAEMGSINPLFILPTALKLRAQQIAKDLFVSVTLGVGQFCTKPGVVFLIAGEGANTFSEALNNEFRTATGGVMLNLGIRDRFVAAGADYFERCNKPLPSRASSATTAEVMPWLLEISSEQWTAETGLKHEAFGPGTIVVTCNSVEDLLACATAMDGQLTASVHCDETADYEVTRQLIPVLTGVAGRLIYNGYPTGVEVCSAMVHGGPYPATTCANSTSVGTHSISRFTRPICLQNMPDKLLPLPLQRENPLNIFRQVDGEYTRGKG